MFNCTCYLCNNRRPNIILTCTSWERPGARAAAVHLLAGTGRTVSQSAHDGDTRADRDWKTRDQTLIVVVVGEVIGEQLGRRVRTQGCARRDGCERSHGRATCVSHHFRCCKHQNYDKNKKCHIAGVLHSILIEKIYFCSTHNDTNY